MLSSSSTPLKTRRNDDVALVQGLADPVGRDRTDARFRVDAVGDDADLRPGQTDGLVAQRVDGHGHERHAHLLTGREQHVHFAGGRLVGDLTGQIDQPIGVFAHCADDHDDLVAFLLGTNGLSRRGEDLLAVGHAGAAELLDDDRHGRTLVVSGRLCFSITKSVASQSVMPKHNLRLVASTQSLTVSQKTTNLVTIGDFRFNFKPP